MKSSVHAGKLLNNYLQSHVCKEGQSPTHTRIGSTTEKIFGGSYFIPDNELNTFWSQYYKHIFENHNVDYLTEKQLGEEGPILVDMDMRYDTEITERQHTKEHIVDGVMCYAEQIAKLIEVQETPISVYVMEKSCVNIQDTVTKDGIHMIIGLKMDRILQLLLREAVLPELKEIWEDLPLENTWEQVLDEGISKGTTNWQLYGSRKPGHKAYLLKYHFVLQYCSISEEWSIEEKDINSFNLKQNFKLLSAQYTGHTSWKMREAVQEDYDIKKNMLTKKARKPKTKTKLKLKGTSIDIRNYADIDDMEKLDAELNRTLFTEEIDPRDYELKEIHQFVMILPEKYWGPGSYDNWIRVGWALKNTDLKLFPTWLKFCSQSSEFSFDGVPQLYEDWYDNIIHEEGLTRRSIMYWAKKEVPFEYEKVRNESVDYFINETLKCNENGSGVTEFDLATVLYALFKDKYICVSIKNNIWFEYINHKWSENDSGNSLRLKISKDLHALYVMKMRDAIGQLQNLDQTDDGYEEVKTMVSKLAVIGMYLKKTTWKNNIMREARELFYDKDFMNNLDVNPYLMCFNNGIVDFKNKIHRKGLPEDYLSKSTNIDYVKLNRDKHKKIIDEIELFMQQLFPIEELRTYMWDHLASCLIGTNDNQTFNIYTGSGANGKSKLVDLMSKILGEYKSTVPITLVTQKRTGIGNTSSEIVQLQGARYAVMQEPSKGDKINEGIMKEITGGDPIQCRALFKESITFIPQFKLVVTTNNLFDIKSNDDGTWRRIRVCDFKSKFTECPYEDENKFPEVYYPYQYKIDKRLEDKFVEWAPIFMALLVEQAYVRQGNVKDCPMVMASSEQYREGQDYLAEFAKEYIQKKEGAKIKKTELREVFKQWYTTNYDRSIPRATELHDFMNKRYGACRGAKGWYDVAIIYDEEEEFDEL